MAERRGPLTLPVNGEKMSVPGVRHLRCPACKEVVLSYDQAGQLQQGAIEAYRAKYSLLSADEIRAVRDRYGLTQARLAHLLRLGANTLSRWEAGRNVQTAAMDVLLRMLRDVPQNYEYLKKKTRAA